MCDELVLSSGRPAACAAFVDTGATIADLILEYLPPCLHRCIRSLRPFVLSGILIHPDYPRSCCIFFFCTDVAPPFNPCSPPLLLLPRRWQIYPPPGGARSPGILFLSTATDTASSPRSAGSSFQRRSLRHSDRACRCRRRYGFIVVADVSELCSRVRILA